ncbi:MAG: lipocalin-like domain-containing protein [Proteobacteria bacterium]|nr:lipocalin-like domain-containing protein [Pseudomonadota bacterium]
MDGSDAAITGLAPVGGLDLTGVWHLADCRLTYASGKIQRPWGNSASGYLIYAPDGHMCQSLNYPAPDGRIACISYCGAYEVLADRVRHYISVSADVNDIGTVREQTIQLEHGRLTLSLSPAPAGGPGSVIDYVWNRAEPV